VKPELAEKLDLVSARIRALERVLVAYSGGVDSSLVLELGHQALGDACLGVIASSPSLPRAELEEALRLARERGIPMRVLHTAEVERADYAANGPDRCYFCKSELYARVGEVALEVRATAILDGFNRDDRGDWRPGRRAAAEQGVVSPLDEAGLGKEEVRLAARGLGLSNWDKPAAACLSSRIPYGIPVTVETLGRVESAERVLRAEGFRQLRVRDANAAATIEVDLADLPRLLEPQRLARIERRLRRLGYSSVAVDEDGYRRGSLNQALGG
jgi:uncharacterized protein